MSFLNDLLSTNPSDNPSNSDLSNYREKIDTQLNRLLKDKIPLERLSEYSSKNRIINEGLSEILIIIEDSTKNFTEFKSKLNKLKTGIKPIQEGEQQRDLSKMQTLGDQCKSHIEKIDLCEREKNRIQSELDAKIREISELSRRQPQQPQQLQLPPLAQQQQEQQEQILRLNEEILRLRKQLNDKGASQSEELEKLKSKNKELIQYNEELVQKIEEIANTQSNIISNLDNELNQGISVLETKLTQVKNNLTELVDSIDDENNSLGPPPAFRRRGRVPELRSPAPPPPPPRLQNQPQPFVQILRGGPIPFGSDKIRLSRGGKTKKIKNYKYRTSTKTTSKSKTMNKTMNKGRRRNRTRNGGKYK
jgi:DNA repair exonuclease SbcCD ATPase subunit